MTHATREHSDGVQRNWPHLVTFALLFSLTLYVIIDMAFPRVSLIRVTAMAWTSREFITTQPRQS